MKFLSEQHKLSQNNSGIQSFLTSCFLLLELLNFWSSQINWKIRVVNSFLRYCLIFKFPLPPWAFALGDSLFIIAYRFDFVKHFFQSFLSFFGGPNKLYWHRLYSLYNFKLRFAFLSRGQLIYFTTSISVCQALFQVFSNFFRVALSLRCSSRTACI